MVSCTAQAVTPYTSGVGMKQMARGGGARHSCLQNFTL